MIEQQIKRLRKKAHMSQEELAVRLSVVRQTVSKWENGLSVPDAEMVLKMAQLFQVPVQELLGVDDGGSAAQLTEELAKANQLLAEKSRRERLAQLANQKRGLILFLCFLSLILALMVQNEILSVCLIGGCLLAALLILLRNMALLTSAATQDFRLKALKSATLFDCVLLVCAVAAAVLTGTGAVHLSGEEERLFAAAVLILIMVFSGLISPRLPFNRHTGLRLPWTVRDEEAWNTAHRTLGFTAVPVAVLYALAVLTLSNFETVTLVAVIVWLGLPALLSFVVWYRKMHGV